MIENLLQYPESTLFGKTVPKKYFYDQLEVSSKMKQRFVNDIEEIIWLYKLAPTTLNVRKGDNVSEIEIMLCPLKDVECPVDVFKFISQKIPHHLVFIDRTVLYHHGAHARNWRLRLKARPWTAYMTGLWAS